MRWRPIAPPSRRLPRNPASRRVSWLVVDDDPRALRFVRDALSEAGFAPLVTGAPQNLSRIIRTERPRLVLLDLMLPGVDGIELMGQVPELADLPVIFISISGYGRDEIVAKVLESGATDCLVKTFSPTELVVQPRLPAERARRRLPHGEAAEPVSAGATEPPARAARAGDHGAAAAESEHDVRPSAVQTRVPGKSLADGHAPDRNPTPKRPQPAGAAGRQIPSLAPDHAAVESPVSSARASGHPREPRT